MEKEIGSKKMHEWIWLFRAEFTSDTPDLKPCYAAIRACRVWLDSHWWERTPKGIFKGLSAWRDSFSTSPAQTEYCSTEGCVSK